jgi:hypothetical protein
LVQVGVADESVEAEGFFPVVEQDQGRGVHDIEPVAELRVGVDVDPVDAEGAGMLPGEAFHPRFQRPTGSTGFPPEVEQHGPGPERASLRVVSSMVGITGLPSCLDWGSQS